MFLFCTAPHEHVIHPAHFLQLRLQLQVVRGVWTEAEIEEIRGAFEDILRIASGPIPGDYGTEAGSEVWVDVRAPEGCPAGEVCLHTRKVEWPGAFHPVFDKYRTSPKLLSLVSSIMESESVKSYKHQINFKMPGGDVEFPWHQDIRPRPAFTEQERWYVQTVSAIDPHTEASGCLYVVPGSHRLGEIAIGERYEKGTIEAVCDVSKAVPCIAAPGDVVLFGSFTVHGSRPNTTTGPRRAFINGYMRGDKCTVGKWAWIEGVPAPFTSDHDHTAFREACGIAATA